MFARDVSIQLKPNVLNDFTLAFEKDIVPILLAQPGFRDETVIACAGGRNITAISLWDTKAHAENYSWKAYPAVLKVLDKFMDGPITVKIANVVNSTANRPHRAIVAK